MAILLFLHCRGGMEFALETDPSLRGSKLFWKVMQAKAPPALAPAVMVQLRLVGLAGIAAAAHAQVAKGLVDPSVAVEKELLALPYMTPAIVKGMLEKRPFLSITELNAFLTGQACRRRNSASSTARRSSTSTSTRRRATRSCSSRARAGAWRASSSRPWKSFAQFDKEIGKYVTPREVARLERYVTIR